MKRSKEYRLLQKNKKINKSKIIAKKIFELKDFEDEAWFKIFVDTPKNCRHEHCKNPRRNKWNDNNCKLTNQELKDLENIKNQLGEIKMERTKG